MLSDRFFGYKYIFSESAKRDLKKLDKPIAKRILAKVDELVTRKECLDVKMMVGAVSPQYRLRVGDYRVIFIKEADEIVIVVIGVGHRRDVYKG